MSVHVHPPNSFQRTEKEHLIKIQEPKIASPEQELSPGIPINVKNRQDDYFSFVTRSYLCLLPDPLGILKCTNPFILLIRTGVKSLLGFQFSPELTCQVRPLKKQMLNENQGV